MDTVLCGRKLPVLGRRVMPDSRAGCRRTPSVPKSASVSSRIGQRECIPTHSRARRHLASHSGPWRQTTGSGASSTSTGPRAQAPASARPRISPRARNHRRVSRRAIGTSGRQPNSRAARPSSTTRRRCVTSEPPPAVSAFVDMPDRSELREDHRETTPRPERRAVRRRPCARGRRQPGTAAR